MSKYHIVVLVSAFIILPLCSATLYSVSTDYKVTYQRSHDELAHCTYDMKANEQGWSYLAIFANGEKDLFEQHRGAGFLEGYVTYRDIYAASNNLANALFNSKTLGAAIHNYIDQQMQYVESMYNQFPRDLFWMYAKAYNEQLVAMHRGYLARIHEQSSLHMYLGFSQFYYLTNVGDLEDLIPAYQSELEQRHGGNCNGYVKLQNGEISVAHNTHNIYAFLLRIFKSYNFPTRDQRVGSQTITFSSRPGDLISKDDFYVLSSGLTVFETSLQNLNRDNFKLLTPKSVPSWLRVCVAANLASSGQEWIDYFLKFSSGTHNNQWMIVDPSRLPTKQNVLMLVEQGFDEHAIVDLTSRLMEKGYVASYNMPYTSKIFTKLGYQGQDYNYENDPRATIFAKYNELMVDAESIKKWMITNEEKDPRGGLAPRYDLADQPSLFGLTDCKVITASTVKDNFIWAISGPTKSNDRFPPFSWNNWPNAPQQGMPKVFNFSWVKVPINFNNPIPSLINNLQEM